MKGGLPNKLNMEADRRPLDPTAVSDPKCWITKVQAERLQSGLVEKIQRLKLAETYRTSSGMDLSDHVIEDASGKLHLIDTKEKT